MLWNSLMYVVPTIVCHVHRTIQRWTSKVTNGYITIQWWIFSVRKLIFWEASSKITLVFPSPKTNLLSDLPKNYFLETQFIGEFRFSMVVSRSLGNSPNDSNSPLTFSSVLSLSKENLSKEYSQVFSQTTAISHLASTHTYFLCTYTYKCVYILHMKCQHFKVYHSNDF